jgi:hypothetical protein
MFLAQIATMVASAASAVLIATLAILEKRVNISHCVLAQIATMVAGAASAVLIATLAILEKSLNTSPCVSYSSCHNGCQCSLRRTYCHSGNTGEKVKYIAVCFLLKLPPWLPVLPPPYLLPLWQYWRKC